jgi:hypothetical protein
MPRPGGPITKTALVYMQVDVLVLGSFGRKGEKLGGCAGMQVVCSQVYSKVEDRRLVAQGHAGPPAG